MAFWESRHIKKTQKDYNCEICNAFIQKGNSCWHERGKFEGEFNDYRLCERCNYVLKAQSDEFLLTDYEGYLTNFIDVLIEHGDELTTCPNCNKSNMRELDFVDNKKLYMDVECESCDNIYRVDLTKERFEKWLEVE